MPKYDYRCFSCGARFELRRKYTDPVPACTECGSDDVKKQITVTGVALKGKGWAKDGYQK